MLFRRFVPLEVTFFTFLTAAGAADDILLRVVHWAVTSGRLKCPMHTTPPYIPHTHTHTHTHRTPLHTAPCGCGCRWREALQTLSQGTLEAVSRRGCTGGTEEDTVPGLKGQPHEILDFFALWKTKQFILRWTYSIPYHALIMYRSPSGNKCTFI